MGSLTGAHAHGDEVLRDGIELPLEKWIGMVGVRGERSAVSLPLTDDEVIQHGEPDGPADVAHEVTDAGDLVEFLSRYTDVIERADGYEDERDADDLNDAVSHHGVEADAEINIGDMEEPEGGYCEADGDDDPRIELAGQDAGNGHHESKRNAARG